MKRVWETIRYMNFLTGGGGEPVGRKLPEPPTLHFLEEEFGYFFPVSAFYIKTENNSHKLWS